MKLTTIVIQKAPTLYMLHIKGFTSGNECVFECTLTNAGDNTFNITVTENWVNNPTAEDIAQAHESVRRSFEAIMSPNTKPQAVYGSKN